MVFVGVEKYKIIATLLQPLNDISPNNTLLTLKPTLFEISYSYPYYD